MEPNLQHNTPDHARNIEDQGSDEDGPYSFLDELGRRIGGYVAGRLLTAIVISALLALITLITDRLPLYFGLPAIILLPALIVAIAVTRSGEKSFPIYGTLLLTLGWAGIVFTIYSAILRGRAETSELDIWHWVAIGCWLLLGLVFAISELQHKLNRET